IEAAAVDPDGRDRQPEGVQEVGDPRPARVLDDYAVAGAKLRLQGALDRVERTARDGDVAVDPVAGEIRLGRGDELRQLRLDAGEPVRGLVARQRVRERRQQPRV